MIKTSLITQNLHTGPEWHCRLNLVRRLNPSLEPVRLQHCSDLISVLDYQISDGLTACSIVCSGCLQRKHQSSTSFFRLWREYTGHLYVDSHHKGSEMWNALSSHGLIMTSDHDNKPLTSVQNSKCTLRDLQIQFVHTAIGWKLDEVKQEVVIDIMIDGMYSKWTVDMFLTFELSYQR